MTIESRSPRESNQPNKSAVKGAKTMKKTELEPQHPISVQVQRALSEDGLGFYGAHKEANHELGVNEPTSGLPVVLAKAQSRALALLLEEADDEREQLAKKWAKQLQRVRQNVISVNRQYHALILSFLQQAYAVYLEIEQVDWRDKIYDSLKWSLVQQGIKTQRNTPDAALIVRYICGKDVSTKSVSDYTRVLEGAKHNYIAAKDFETWVKQRTMTKVIEEQRHLERRGENYEDRMRRARIVVLRLLEAREEMPVAVKTMSERTMKTVTAWHAEREWLNPNSEMWIAIGTARRRYDRESFYADVLLHTVLRDTNLEFVVINHLAKHYVENVEMWEQKVQNLETAVFGEEVWEHPISSCHDESLLNDRKRAERQQASHKKLKQSTGKS